MIGNSGEGFKVAMSTGYFPNNGYGASLGFAKRALDEAIRRSKERGFCKSISEFQLIQAKIVDMAVKIDAMALLIYRSAWTRDKKATNKRIVHGQTCGTEAAQEVIDQAVQIFGGMEFRVLKLNNFTEKLGTSHL